MLRALLALAVDILRSRQSLLLENLALRQQLATFTAGGRRPRIRQHDRLFWVLLFRSWVNWRKALAFVSPETVVRWHRRGFRAYWTWLSRRGRRPGRPKAGVEVARLIRQMAIDNPTWGAPRVHGELLKLGFTVSERTVSRLLPKRTPRGDSLARWKTFLLNHADGIAAMDMFTVPTVGFRVLYVLFVIRHGSRQVVHIAVSQRPSPEWVCQQLREAFPFEDAPAHLIFDRDSTFSADVVRTVRGLGTSPARTSFRSPWQNGIAERFVGTVRRELLRHVIVLSERHLHRLLQRYLAYYHEDRSHLGLAKHTPWRRAVQPRPSRSASVAALPRLGGLHHRYEWRNAA